MPPELLAEASALDRMNRIREHLTQRLAQNGRVWSNDTTARDRVFHAIDYVGRASTPRTTSSYELQDVRRIMSSFLSQSGLSNDAIVADLGAGDGRLTSILQEHGFANIFSLDIDQSNVERLADRYGVDAVCADVTERALFPEGSFDMIVAWGLLTAIPDFAAALDTITGWIRPGGYLITAEPTLESVLLYTLVRGDPGEFQRTLHTRTRAAMWNDKELRYRVYTTREVFAFMRSCSETSVLDEQNVGIFPSLLAGGVVPERGMGEREAAAFLDGVEFSSIDGVPRQIAFLSRRCA